MAERVTRDRIRRISLPLFITPENKNISGVLMFLAAAALYLASNHFFIFAPKLLPMFWADRSVPFVPGTVWIYASEYLFFPVVYWSCRDLVNLNKYLYSFLALQTVSVVIFWLWPTTYPRDLFPLTGEISPLTYSFFSFLRVTDTPANCCPSLHVSSVYLSSFLFRDEQKGLFPFFFTWGTAIALSTLTTKQHYLIDVVTGLLMAMIFYWFFHRRVEYRPIADRGNACASLD